MVDNVQKNKIMLKEQQFFPPSVLTDTKAVELIKKVILAKEALISSEQELASRIAHIQYRHTHGNWIDVRVADDNFKAGTLVNKVCGGCGYHTVKPDGDRYKICRICWAPMKDEGRANDEDRTSHYQCTKCSNHETHT